MERTQSLTGYLLHELERQTSVVIQELQNIMGRNQEQEDFPDFSKEVISLAKIQSHFLEPIIGELKHFLKAESTDSAPNRPIED